MQVRRSEKVVYLIVSEAQARKDWYDNIMGSNEEKNRQDDRHSSNIVSENDLTKSSSPEIEDIEQWHDDDDTLVPKRVYLKLQPGKIGTVHYYYEGIGQK